MPKSKKHTRKALAAFQRKIIALLAGCFQVPGKIGLGTKLAALHRAGPSLYGFVDFTYAVERAFHITLTDDQALRLTGRGTSVQSAVRSIRRILAGKK